jgi:hypothetical protein
MKTWTVDAMTAIKEKLGTLIDETSIPEIGQGCLY